MNYVRELLWVLAVVLWAGIGVFVIALIALWARYLSVWGMG